MTDGPWHYSTGGEPSGPVSSDQIRAFLASGSIGRDTLVWTPGMAAWQPLGSTVLAVAMGAPPSPGFGDAIRICLSKYVVWAGRATRPEYWWFYLFCILISLGASFVDVALVGAGSGVTPVSALVSLGLFLPQLSATVRRLHDTDRSAWWILLPVGGLIAAALLVGALIVTDAPTPSYMLAVALAVAGIIAPIVFLCQAGTPGPNRYG